MKRLRLTTTLLTLSILLFPSAAPAATRGAGSPAGVNRREMAGRVRAEFLHAWRGYERYAWGHDELQRCPAVCPPRLAPAILAGCSSNPHAKS